MIAFAFILLIALALIAYFASKLAHKYYLQSINQQGNLDSMEKRNMLLNAKLQHLQEHREEVFWAAKAKGESKGYKEMLLHLPQLYSGVAEMQKGLYADFGKQLSEREALKLNAQVHQDSYKSVREINEKYKRNIEDFESKLNRIQEERNEAVEKSNKYLELYKAEKAKSIGKKPQKSLKDPFQTDSQIPPGQDSDTNSGLVRYLSDTIQTDFEYKVTEKDKYYFERIDDRTVGVYKKSSGSEMGRFYPMNLSKGVTWDIGGIKVILCIHEDCNTISFTSQPKAKACCPEHRDQYYYEKRFIQTS